jgi:hypothetical protein
MERLAMMVSDKLEDGDVKGAVRLAANDNLIATYCQETIDALMASTPMQPVHHIVQRLT